MSSKKRKYRERISSSGGGVLDLFDHPSFRSSVAPSDPVRPVDTTDDDEAAVDDDELADAPAADQRPA